MKGIENLSLRHKIILFFIFYQSFYEKNIDSRFKVIASFNINDRIANRDKVLLWDAVYLNRHRNEMKFGLKLFFYISNPMV